MEIQAGDTFFTSENNTYIKIKNVRVCRLHMRTQTTYVRYDWKTQDGRHGNEETSLDAFIENIIKGD
jgi:hypothetical protein